MKDLIYLVLVIIVGVVTIKWYKSREFGAEKYSATKLTEQESEDLLDTDEDASQED